MFTTTTEIIDDTLVVTAIKDLREFDSNNIDSKGDEIVQMMDDPRLRNVVMDLSNTDYCGSSALNWFVRIDKKAQAKNGRLILVGLSPHEREIMHVTKLDGLWKVCNTREEALASLKQSAPATSKS